MAIADWSPTASSNGTTLGVNIAEGCPPSNVNNAIRALMADVATGINFSILGTFLASTSLSSARTALGVDSTGAAVSALDALTPAANKVPYFTGASTAALADLTSFARTLLDDGDAATARATLGALGKDTATFGSNSFAVKITLDATTTMLVQGGSGTLAANTTGSITFANAYSVAPVCIVTGGDNNTNSEGQIRISANPSTTGVAIVNAGPASGTYNYIVFGKA